MATGGGDPQTTVVDPNYFKHLFETRAPVADPNYFKHLFETSAPAFSQHGMEYSVEHDDKGDLGIRYTPLYPQKDARRFVTVGTTPKQPGKLLSVSFGVPDAQLTPTVIDKYTWYGYCDQNRALTVYHRYEHNQCVDAASLLYEILKKFRAKSIDTNGAQWLTYKEAWDTIHKHETPPRLAMEIIRNLTPEKRADTVNPHIYAGVPPNPEEVYFPEWLGNTHWLDGETFAEQKKFDLGDDVYHREHKKGTVLVQDGDTVLVLFNGITTRVHPMTINTFDFIIATYARDKLARISFVFVGRYNAPRGEIEDHSERTKHVLRVNDMVCDINDYIVVGAKYDDIKEGDWVYEHGTVGNVIYKAVILQRHSAYQPWQEGVVAGECIPTAKLRKPVRFFRPYNNAEATNRLDSIDFGAKSFCGKANLVCSKEFRITVTARSEVVPRLNDDVYNMLVSSECIHIRPNTGVGVTNQLRVSCNQLGVNEGMQKGSFVSFVWQPHDFGGVPAAPTLHGKALNIFGNNYSLKHIELPYSVTKHLFDDEANVLDGRFTNRLTPFGSIHNIHLEARQANHAAFASAARSNVKLAESYMNPRPTKRAAIAPPVLSTSDDDDFGDDDNDFDDQFIIIAKKWSDEYDKWTKDKETKKSANTYAAHFPQAAKDHAHSQAEKEGWAEAERMKQHTPADARKYNARQQLQQREHESALKEFESTTISLWKTDVQIKELKQNKKGFDKEMSKWTNHEENLLKSKAIKDKTRVRLKVKETEQWKEKKIEEIEARLKNENVAIKTRKAAAVKFYNETIARITSVLFAAVK